MKKFDKLLRETYRLLNEQDPNVPVDPNMMPLGGEDLGAADPGMDSIGAEEEGEPQESILSPAGEVALVELAYLALFIDPKDIEQPYKDTIDQLLPRGIEGINQENSKEVMALLTDIVTGENPGLEIASSEIDDKKRIESLPAI